MGTNYYFRKKSVDATRIEMIVDSLNHDFRSLVAQYNEKLQEAFSDMELDSTYEFDDSHWFYSPDSREDYGDIHVGKLSSGWKPLLQANAQFHSLQTLKQWHEQNKHDHVFITGDEKTVPFDDFLKEIAERNQNDNFSGHGYSKDSDGYEWTRTEFF